MKKTSVGDLFRGKENYNCAQTVAKAFQDEYNIPKETFLATQKHS